MVKCNGLEQKLCKLPECIWVNKKRKFCRTSKKKKTTSINNKFSYSYK